MITDYEDKTLEELIEKFKKNQIYIERMEQIISTVEGEDLEQAHNDYKLFIEDQFVLGYEFLRRHV